MEPIGGGVDTPKPPKVKRPRAKKSEPVKLVDPAVVHKDPPAEWLDRPVFKDKSFENGNYKLGQVLVSIFDLNVPEQLASYNVLLNEAAREDNNLVICEEKKEFSTATQSWKVLIKTQKLLFRKLI